ncbi:Protein YigP clustered withubiquinone biosynthetic genes [Salmonella enterica subsp. enterica]|uniref:Protein YigP clustered withubiquinone biosynthetic genes n=1 Tax=Salmonella enterica I TaxID=59201 RepID=A0A3S4JD16_SALET|nr:Protein YigP clustered withubiquinone biosynthetic genes [Salmonella enterica subsp. enterica]
MPLKRSLKSGVWRLGPLEVAWFAEETAAVERAVDALTTRLEKLEAK